jgi:23S rRNA C2498 (ribose-2'-O)-methylase RlmM
MPNAPDTLAEMYDFIARCRRIAIDVADREAAKSLSQLAHKLEAYVRRAIFRTLNTGRNNAVPISRKPDN